MNGRRVLLAARAPDAGAVAEAMFMVAPELVVEPSSGSAVLRFRTTATGPVALCVDAPVLVPARSEVARLLGPDAARRAPSPLWWLDIRAALDSAQLADRLGAELRTRTGGLLWPDVEDGVA